MKAKIIAFFLLCSFVCLLIYGSFQKPINKKINTNKQVETIKKKTKISKGKTQAKRNTSKKVKIIKKITKKKAVKQVEIKQEKQTAIKPKIKKAEIKKEVSYRISIPQLNKVLYQKNMTFEEGETAYDLLKKTGISFSGTYYISQIGNYQEKQYGLKSGWIYLVNGSMPNVAAKNYLIKQGDKIEWEFVNVEN